MNLPSIKVSVWPFPKEGKIKATAKITIGDAISVCPIKIIKGKAGLFLGMPQIGDECEKFRDVFHPCTKEAREALTEMVLQTYDPSKTRYREFPGKEELQIKPKLLICRNEASGFVGFASLEINKAFKVEHMRMFRNPRGRLSVQYPARSFVKDGEVAIAEIVTFKNDYDETLRKQISEVYCGGESRMPKETNMPGQKSLDELMELRRQRESKTRVMAYEMQQDEEPEEEPEQEEGLVLV